MVRTLTHVMVAVIASGAWAAASAQILSATYRVVGDTLLVERPPRRMR